MLHEMPDENNVSPTLLSESAALAWIEDTLGERLLAYLLGCTVSELSTLRAGETEHGAERSMVLLLEG
jgi:hypothetical protein